MSGKLLFLTTFLAAASLTAPAPGDEEVWKSFLLWLARVPPIESPGKMLAAWSAHVTASGADRTEAERQRAVVQRLMRTREDGWQVLFNNIYTTGGSGFNTRPNATLTEAVEKRRPGRALDAGMGQGRNAVFLALKGWDVTGFDISDAGLAIARKDAARAGVRINAVQASSNSFDYGTAQWDLILLNYVPFGADDPAYVQRLRKALRPGGLVVVESFASDASAPARRPVDIDPAALRRVFRGFKLLKFEDTVTTPDWSSEKARIVRMIAQDPRPPR